MDFELADCAEVFKIPLKYVIQIRGIGQRTPESASDPFEEKYQKMTKSACFQPFKR